MLNRRVTDIGSPEKRQAFIARHQKFFNRLDNLMSAENAAFSRTITATGLLDPVIFYLGMRSVQDFNAIVLLAANGNVLSAKALIRGMYERVVTAAYLEKHPEEVEAFAEFDFVQRKRAAESLKEAGVLTPEDENQLEELMREYDRVKPRFMFTQCRDCGRQDLGPSWTKLSFVAMAKKVPPLDDLLVPAYYIPLSQAHSTLKSVSSLLDDKDGQLVFREDYSDEADEFFRLAYLLLMHTFKIQATHFKSPEIKEAAERAIGDYLEIYPLKGTSPDELHV